MALSTILLAGLPLQSTIQSAPFDEANLYQMAEVLLIKCWAPTKTHLSMVPPLGLMYLASFLRELGHSVRLTRWNDVPEATARIHALIRERKPDVIGISAIVPECGTLRELMPKLQEIAPGVPVMVGGHLASANPLTTLRYRRQRDRPSRRRKDGRRTGRGTCLRTRSRRHTRLGRAS